MTEMTIEGGQFCLDGKPVFIQAGEFHYFRTPRDEWRNRLDLLKAAGFNAVAAYMPWLWHQPVDDALDFNGHTHPMRDLAGFLDLAGEMGLYIIARPGPYIMAETINEGIPPWVFEKHPQIAFISQDGKTQNIASYMHPDFLSCVSAWYREIFKVLAPRQVTHGGRIIMVQLDNEMGMMAWVRNIMDINPDTLARFTQYLEKNYGKQFQQRYPTTDLPTYLRENLVNPTGIHTEGVVEGYRRFYRDYLREYTTFLLSEAKKNGLGVPPVINIHGFANGGKTFPIGISQLIEAMRTDEIISATDVYPGHIDEGNFHQLLMVNEMTKTLQNPRQPLFSIEFQAGGNNDFSGNQASLFDLHSRLCISSGMRAINHYLFFDGENDPILSPMKRHDWGHPVRLDGSLRRHYARYPKLSAVLAAYGTDLVRSKPETVTTIAFQLDDFMTEANNASTKASTDIITHQREDILFDFIARGLALTHRPFDCIELENGNLDARNSPLVWMMMEKRCSAVVQKKLVDYLHQGGKVVMVGRMCVEDYNHQPCTLLRDAIGVKDVEGGVPFSSGFMDAFKYKEIPVSFMETYQGSFDETFATSSDGKVTGFIKKVGKGTAMVLGASLTANTLGDLDILNQVALKMDCQPLFKMSDWADVRVSKSENGSFLFVNNYQDDPLETIIEYKGVKLLGGNPLRLPARRGAILPLDWQISKGITLLYSTFEVTAVIGQDSDLTLKMDQPDFTAELTLSGWRCNSTPGNVEPLAGNHFLVRGGNGVINLNME